MKPYETSNKRLGWSGKFSKITHKNQEIWENSINFSNKKSGPGNCQNQYMFNLFHVSQEFYSTWTETPQQVTGRQPPSAPVPASVYDMPGLSAEMSKTHGDPCDTSTGLVIGIWLSMVEHMYIYTVFCKYNIYGHIYIYLHIIIQMIYIYI